MREGWIGNEGGREKQRGRQRCIREDRHGKLRSTYGKSTHGGLCTEGIEKAVEFICKV
jgi:hypothetical protein